MTPDPQAAITMLEEWAQQERAKQPPHVQAIIDAIVLAAEVRNKSTPKNKIVERLRRSWIRHKNHSPVLAAYMVSAANQLDTTQ